MPRHHYLPRFYLKEFTDPATPAGYQPYVWVRTPDQRWRKRGPANVAEKSGYYSFVDEEGVERQEIEKMFAQIESIAASIYRDPVSRERPLSFQHRWEFATFVAILQARIPVTIEHLQEHLAEVARRTLAIVQEVHRDDPAKWEAYKERLKRRAGVDLGDMPVDALDPARYKITASRIAALGFTLASIGEIGYLIAQMGWEFLVSRSGSYFITSDYPVGVVEPVSLTPSPGLTMRFVEITVPLSRTLALLCGWKAPGGTRWRLASENAIEQVNLRTALRARTVIAPTPAFPGSDRIVQAITAVQPQSEGPRVLHLPDKPGYLIELAWPKPSPVICPAIRPLLQAPPDAQTGRDEESSGSIPSQRGSKEKSRP